MFANLNTVHHRRFWLGRDDVMVGKYNGAGVKKFVWVRPGNVPSSMQPAKTPGTKTAIARPKPKPSNGSWCSLNGKRGIRMKFTIAVHCAIYVVARNSRDDRTLVHWAALVPLFFVHTLRYLPSSAFAPEQVDPRSRWMQWRGVGVDCRRRRPAHCNQAVAV